jgi:glucose-1-phosphate thymidylyltransferase
VVCNARFADAFRSWREQGDWPVPVHVLDDGASDPESRRGATGDLAFALRERALDGRDLLVLAGDNLLDCRLGRARELLERRRAPVLIVREVARDGGPSRYNEVELDSDGRVLHFREKPEQPHSPLAAIALYFYPPAIAEWVESYLAGGGNPDAPGHFVAWLHAHTPVFATPLEGRWFDIGDAQTLAEARSAFAG